MTELVAEQAATMVWWEGVAAREEEVEEVAGEARAVPPRVRSRVGGGAPPALSQVRVRRSPAAAVVARTPPTPRVREGGGAGPRGEGVG